MTQTIDWQANRANAYRWFNYLTTLYMVEQLDRVEGFRVDVEPDFEWMKRKLLVAKVDPDTPQMFRCIVPFTEKTVMTQAYFDVLREAAYMLAVRRGAPPVQMECYPPAWHNRWQPYFHPPQPPAPTLT